MSHSNRPILILALCLAMVWATMWAAPPAAATAPPPPYVEEPSLSPVAPAACDPDGQQASGAIYRICMPSLFWNGDLVIFAHGYVPATEPVRIPDEQMDLGFTTIPDLVTALGYAFATTSYRANGLAVVPGLADILDLVDIFIAEKGEPDRVYLTGGSEGGLIAALAVEDHPEVFGGGLAMCGPYGDFRRQIDVIGDFRAVFDYFFPGLVPGDPIEIPDWLIADWENYYATNIQPVLEDPASAGKVSQLLAVTGAAVDPDDPSTRETTVRYLLSYNVLATRNAMGVLGGQPFDNTERIYTGSADDAALNEGVRRVHADQSALDEIEARYQTSGRLAVPLVTLHTTGDPLVPYWHANVYRGKTIHADNIALHDHRTSEAYGHCSFDYTDVLQAFNRLVDMVDEPPPYVPVQRVFLPLGPAAYVQ